MIAAVMCGGQGSRMEGGSATEKPLLLAGGLPIIARVLDALFDSRRFEKIVAVVSPKTPETRVYLNSKGVEVIQTPGRGYSVDLSLALGKLRPATVFVISADMPLMTPQVIGEIASVRRTKPLLSVVLRREFVESVGITPSVTFRNKSTNGEHYCHSGVGIFDTSRHSRNEGDDNGGGVMEEEHLVMDRIELAINVNTKEELELAEKLLIQRA